MGDHQYTFAPSNLRTENLLRFLLSLAMNTLARAAALVLVLACLLEIWRRSGADLSPPFWKPEALDPPAALAGTDLVSRLLASSAAFGLAYLLVLVTGLGWGLLGARLRRFRLAPVLAAPACLAACAPGFWIVLLLAHRALFHWDQPGFANELAAEGGAGRLLAWWHLSFLAALAALGPIAWLLRSTAADLTEHAAAPYLERLFLRGHDGESLFYRNAFRDAAPSLAARIDRPVAPLLGALVPLEWAFRFDGAGNLLVEALRTAWLGGVFAIGLWMGALALAAKLVRDIAVKGGELAR